MNSGGLQYGLTDGLQGRLSSRSSTNQGVEREVGGKKRRKKGGQEREHARGPSLTQNELRHLPRLLSNTARSMNVEGGREGALAVPHHSAN